MQDTPTFETYRSQFSQINLGNLLDQRESVQEPYRSFLEETYGKLNDYFTDEEFRKTLSITRKNNIEGQINNIIAQFNNLQSWQNDGITSVSGNIESIYSNISSYIDDFDTRFTVPRQLYKINSAGNIDAIAQDAKSKSDEIISQSQEKLKTVNDAANEVRSTLALTEDMVGAYGSKELANYYQNLATGRTTENQQTYTMSQKIPLRLKWVKRLFLVSIPALFLVIIGGAEVIKAINPTREQVIIFSISVITPCLIMLGLLALNAFNKHFPGGYTRSAMVWMIGAIIATIGTAVYAAILVFEMGSNAEWAEIIPKIIGLLAPAYLIRFFVQNYKANKHLEVSNTHRATLASVIRPYTKLITHTNPDFEKDLVNARSEIIEAAALVLFSQGETGFLTTKEGAGNSDDMLDGFRYGQK